jgi:hypothetical protein
MNGARRWGFPEWPKQPGKRPTILISGPCQTQGKNTSSYGIRVPGRGAAQAERNTISGQRDRNYAG